MSVASKLTYLNDTKKQLYTNINAIGGDLTNESTFREYAEELDNMWENLPHTTGEGTSISLNTKKGKAKVENFLGDTLQDGTPTPESPIPIQTGTGRQKIDDVGKNLFKPFSFSRTNGGVSFTYDLDGSITCNGTATSQANSMLRTDATGERILTLGAGTYTVSGYTNDIRIQVAKASDGTILVSSNNAQTFTIEETTQVFLKANIYTGTTVNNVKIYPMIEFGSTSSEYEEYKKKNYEIWLDNNLFDKTDYRDNSRINSTGGNYEENGCFTARMIKVEPNTTYVKNSPTEDGYHRVAFYTGTTTDTFISKTESNTFTTPATCQYLRFCGLKTELDTAQLLKQNQERKIIELCKIGNYQDKIYKQDEKWYLYKEIGKVILNGSEVWSNVNTTTNNRTYRTPTVVTKGTDDLNDIISNYFERKLGVWALNDGTSGFGRVTDTGYLIFSMPRATIANTTEFKEWLGTHNTIVYYILETPTLGEITDIELIEQLEEAYRFDTYQEKTNITVYSADLPIILDVTALSNEIEESDEEEIPT